MPRGGGTRPYFDPFGQANELGKRSHRQLLHNPGSMHFDSFLNSTEISCDLLIESAGYDMSKDLSLARGEGFNATHDRVHLRTISTDHEILLQRKPDSRQKLIGRDGLGKKVHGSCSHRADAHRYVASPGEKHDWTLAPRFRKRSLDFQAVRLINSDIENRTARRCGIVLGEECTRGRKALNLESRLPQQSFQGFEDRRVVIDQIYCVCRGNHKRPPPSAGRDTQNVAPRPGLLNAQRLPPWASIIERQIDKPSPNPRDFVVKNGWNRLLSLSSLIPVPWSVTEMRVAFSSVAVLTTSLRSPGAFSTIASQALWIKLRSTC
jgi:hypothetical protein